MRSQLEHFSHRRHLGQLIHGKAYTLAVASGKGGVGKSTLCVNLAVRFAQMRKRVLLLDGDPGMADLHIFLGKTPARNWGDFLRGTHALAEIIQPNLFGVDLIHGFSGMDDGNHGSTASMERLLASVGALSKNYDLILIDVGAGVHESSMVLTTAVHETLLVVNPEFTAIADAYGALKTICKWNPDQEVTVAINRVQSAEEGLETYKSFSSVCERFLGRKPALRGVLRESLELPQALLKQEPAVNSFANCKWAQDLLKMADEYEKDLRGMNS